MEPLDPNLYDQIASFQTRIAQSERFYRQAISEQMARQMLHASRRVRRPSRFRTLLSVPGHLLIHAGRRLVSFALREQERSLGMCSQPGSDAGPIIIRVDPFDIDPSEQYDSPTAFANRRE